MCCTTPGSWLYASSIRKELSSIAGSGSGFCASRDPARKSTRPTTSCALISRRQRQQRRLGSAAASPPGLHRLEVLQRAHSLFPRQTKQSGQHLGGDQGIAGRAVAGLVLQAEVVGQTVETARPHAS